MATDKINNYSIGDNNFESVMLTLDQTFRNKHDCYSFSATALKAGSVIEINGSLYPVTQDVTLPDMSSNKYLMAVPTSSGTFTLLATSTAPTWSDRKQGFYGTSTTDNYKYIAVLEGSVMYKYNDRPFYVGAIYLSTLKASAIDCYSVAFHNYTMTGSQTYLVKKPCHIRAASGFLSGWQRYHSDGWKTVGITSDLNEVGEFIMPGYYRVADTGGVIISGIYGSTSLTDVIAAV